MLASPCPAQTPEKTRQAIGSCYLQAYEYGNYQACLRIQPLLVWANQMAPAAGFGSQEWEVLKLVFLTSSGYYSQVIGPAQRLLKDPTWTPSADSNARLRYCLVRCGLEAGYPELVNQYLPEALKWSKRASNPELRFCIASLAAQRELDSRPDLSTEALIAKHDECWRILDGFEPTPLNTGGEQTSSNIIAWERELTLRSLQSPLLKAQLVRLLTQDLTRLAKLADQGISPAGGYNPQYRIGWCDSLLEIAQLLRQQGSYADCEKLLKQLDEGLAPALADVADWQKQIDKWIADGIEKLKPNLASRSDVASLHFSLFEGNIDRVAARLQQQWIRLILAKNRSGPIDASTRQELHRRLRVAAEAQASAARGQGFLGLEEVRWDALAVLFRLQENGWQKEAAALIQESLDLSRKLGFPLGQIAALTYQGDLDRSAARLPQALDSYRQALLMVEKFVTEQGADRTRQRFKHLYDAVTEIQLESGKSEEAFATQARLQEMKTVGQSHPAQLSQAAALRGRTGALEQELIAARASGSDSKPVEQLLARTRGEFYAELSKIRTSNPRYESMLAIRPVNFAQLQKKLPPDTCLIQYFPSDTALYIFFATSTDLKIHKLALASDELQTLVAQFRRAVLDQKSQAYQVPLLKLHSLLIDPLEADLAGKQVLAFIPTGVLDYLPLGALARPAPGGTGLQYLIQRKQVAIILKSSDLDALSAPPSRPRGGVLALGNPDGSLPGASREARDIAELFQGSQLYLGKEATADHLKGGMAYVHLATHGVLDEEDPNASYLLMAGPKPHLSVQGIFDLRLEGVRVVTLSACQTALGFERGTQGSELSTLAGAFSVAGSNSVVASLWSVEDQSTRLLMTEFYSALKQGDSLAAALQRAQLKVLQQPAYASPFFWAPFELLGDWR